MPKELKDFKVWHPPPPSDDEPLVEDAWRDDAFKWIRRSRRLTVTGILWLVVPGYLFMAKQLSFSLSEFLIWIGAWSVSLGALVSRMIGAHLPWPYLVTAAVMLAHLHSVMFTASLYRSRFFPEESDEQRVFKVLIMQLLALVPVLVIVGLSSLRY